MYLPHLLLFVILLALAVGERLWPAQALPKVAGWHQRALWLNGVLLPLLALGSLTWEPWLQAHRLLQFDPVPPVLVALCTFLVVQLVLYGWHRLKHQSDLLWRWQHQIHHSPSRIELLTAYYAHPLEVFINLLLIASVMFGVLGLHPEAAAWFVLFQVGGDAIAHANIATPHALGYFVQRPEMHRLHHELHVHARNYGLPLWDLVFGTWSNPRKTAVVCGFAGDREQRLADMLLARDLHRVTARPCCSGG